MDFEHEYQDENGVQVKTTLTGISMSNLSVRMSIYDLTIPDSLCNAKKYLKVRRDIALVQVSYFEYLANFFVDCTESGVLWHVKGQGDVANSKAYDVRKFLQPEQITEIETMHRKMVRAAKQNPDEMKKFGIDLSRIATPENA